MLLCIEGGGGNCVLIYSNKYSHNTKVEKRSVLTGRSLWSWRRPDPDWRRRPAQRPARPPAQSSPRRPGSPPPWRSCRWDSWRARPCRSASTPSRYPTRRVASMNYVVNFVNALANIVENWIFQIHKVKYKEYLTPFKIVQGGKEIHPWRIGKRWHLRVFTIKRGPHSFPPSPSSPPHLVQKKINAPESP